MFLSELVVKPAVSAVSIFRNRGPATLSEDGRTLECDGDIIDMDDVVGIKYVT